MTPAELSRTVRHAVCRAVADGALAVEVPESVRIERPRPGGRGDWATNVALRLAGPAGRSARAVAEELRARIAGEPGIGGVEITGAGFLNITVAEDPLERQRGVVERAREDAAPGPVGRYAGGSRQDVWDETVAVLRRLTGYEASDASPVRVRQCADTSAELGSDAVRWAFLSAAAHDRARLEAPLLRQHESNPLFTVRYAHSRARALTREAARLGFAASSERYLDTDGDTEVERRVADWAEVLDSAARLGAPDRIARHLEGTAEALLGLQHTVLPVGGEKPSAAHRSRLALAEAAGAVLAGGLSLLGISAPEHL
ncbi:ArgS-related anticodon-binding protein NrtL [Streptomyces qinzhouensis]|uniref:arginine--tRNA ligase n=1 Tax=Streptomyces qinzhouensis TaxID=2599401 RepID=A0A5B8JC53_9ACTN|nr:arginine--tRNA ligase [Streptomyces qinzhouensis]QDY79027.1 arginine--tRNA ligase [Streptomyces qinzhouensis]